MKQLIKLYHGTSIESEILLLKNGWKPNQVSRGSQQGNPAYLYLSTTPESANWYACMKGNDGSVLEIYVAIEDLIVDPEDGLYTIPDEPDKPRLYWVEKEIKHGGSLALINSIPANQFKKFNGKLTTTGCDQDDYLEEAVKSKINVSLEQLKKINEIISKKYPRINWGDVEYLQELFIKLLVIQSCYYLMKMG